MDKEDTQVYVIYFLCLSYLLSIILFTIFLEQTKNTNVWWSALQSWDINPSGVYFLFYYYKLKNGLIPQ